MGVSVNNKRIAKNTIFLYIRMIVVLLVSIYTTRIVLNALGVVDYGINNVVAGFVSMFTFLNTSMSNSIQRFYNFTLGENKDHTVADVYNTALIIQFILAIVIFILLESFGLWYMYNKMIIPEDRFVVALWIFQFSILSMFFIIMQIPYSSAILAYEHMNFYAYIALFDVFAKLLVAFLVSHVNYDRLLIYGLSHLIITIISFLLYYSYSKHKVGELRLNLNIHKDLFKPMLSFSGWNMLGTFSRMIKGQGLNMLLNSFFGPIVNAARGISYTIMGALQGFQNNIIVAFRPQLVQAYAGKQYDRVKELFYISSKVSYLMLAIISVPIIFEIDYILHLWLGDDAVPDYTNSFTILILVNMLISSLNTPLSQIVHATGKMKNYQIITSVIVCLILPISWLFLRLGYNPNSVYVISLVITIINQIVCLIVVNRIFQYDIKYYLKDVILSCCIFSILVPIAPYVLVTFMNSSFLRLCVVLIVSVLWSCLVGYLIVLNKTEKSYINKIIGKYVRRSH